MKAELRLVVLSVAMMSLTGCNYHKLRKVESPVTVPEAFSESDAPTTTTEAEKETRNARWWISFGDDTLNGLIERALEHNHQVRGGWARARQAHYMAMQARAARFPQIGTIGLISRGTSITPGIGNLTTTFAQASLPVSFELDLFARRAREHQADKLEAEASQLDQDSLMISVSAQVAEGWYDLVDERLQRSVFERQLETDESFLKLVELRFKQGLASAVDMHQQRQRVAGQQSNLALARGRETIATHQLVVLIGQAPGEDFSTKNAAFPTLNDPPDISVPASLVRMRPDVRAANRRVIGADRSVAGAIGARLPQITASFTPGYTWIKAKRLGTPTDTVDGFTWNVGALLSMPLFDGRLGKAKIMANRALLDQAVENYAQTILTALTEVEGALALERYQQQSVMHLKEQLRLADVTLNSARIRYREGLTDFLQVLTAIATKQAAEIGLLSAQRQLVSNRIQLHRALGGEWPDDMKEPER